VNKISGKVLHLSYSSSGGAGTVALRLSKYQKEILGIDSEFLFVTRQSFRNNPFVNPKILLAALKDEYLVKEDRRSSMISLNRNQTNYKILKEINASKYILHFHWMNGLINYSDIVDKLLVAKKKIWTLHDMEPFSGGCHHAMGCKKFETICTDCPLVRKKYRERIRIQHIKKLDISRDSDNIEIVTPTNWLKQRAERSSLLNSKRISVIYNPVDNIFFKNNIYHNLEHQNSNQFIVGFVSVELSSPLKNYNALKVIVKELNRSCKKHFKILAIGRYAGNSTNNDFLIEVGQISNSKILAEHYKLMDVLVVPSQAETFGLSIAEAAASEVPAIVLAGTASQELVIHNETGFIAQSNSEIFEYIKKYSEYPSLSKLHGKQAKIRAKSLFSEEIVNNRYLELYFSTSSP